MKKLIIALLLTMMTAGVALAEGGKNQGDTGAGNPEPVHDPMPFEWPGIDW